LAEIQGNAMDVLSITFSDFTATYIVDNDATAAVAVGEIDLLATFDDILVAADVTI
jgi:hypothetical protein